MNQKKPHKGILGEILTNITAWYIYNESKKQQPDNGDCTMHSRTPFGHSRNSCDICQLPLLYGGTDIRTFPEM